MSKLKVYNLFPRSYASIPEMTGVLDHIKIMDFNTVWLNPIQQSGAQTLVKRTDRITKEQREVTSSIYAATGERTFLPHLMNGQTAETAKQQIREFTTKAYQLEITPIFDLVLHHLSLDSPLIEKHPNWFSNDCHPEWDDIKAFHYTEESIDEIFEGYWKPLIDWYIDALGFRGVRVDAAKEVKPIILEKAISYIRQKLHQLGIQNPVILAEYFEPKLNLNDNCKPIEFSHIMNRVSSQSPNLHSEIIYQTLSKGAIKLKTGEFSAFNGQSIGYSGNHDRLPLALQCIQRFNYFHPFNRFNSNDFIHRTSLMEMMKQTIAEVALGSEGGWYLLSGDEFGDRTIKECFTRPDGSDIYPQDQERAFDLTNYIAKINRLLDQLPQYAHQHYRATIKKSLFSSIITITRSYDDQQVMITINLQTNEMHYTTETEPLFLPALPLFPSTTASEDFV